MRPSAQNAALLAAVPTVLAVALLGYHMGRLSVQAQQKDGEAASLLGAFTRASAHFSCLHNALNI